jgi:hypothetical protein
MDLNDESLIELEAPSTARLDKAIPGAKWSVSRKLWLLPLSWAACTVSREVLGDELQVGDKLRQWSQEEYESRVLPASVAREATDGPKFTPAEPGDPADVVDRLDGEYRGEREGRAIDTVEKAEQAWWWDIWRGMPEFLNRDLTSVRHVIVNFRNIEDVERFAKLIGQNVGPSEPAIWFPEVEVVHEIDWRYADEDDPTNEMPNRPGQIRRFGLEEPKTAKAAAPRKRKHAAASPAAAKPDVDRAAEWAAVIAEADRT